MFRIIRAATTLTLALVISPHNGASQDLLQPARPQTGEARSAEIQAVGDPVIDEGSKPLLVDGIPEPQFSGYAVAKPMKQRKPIAAFRSRGKSEQFDRLNMLQQCAI